MFNNDPLPPVLNEAVFRLLSPEPPAKEEPLIARFCAMCAAPLGEEHPIERIDTGLWCPTCQTQIDANPSPRKPGFLYGLDDEWYVYYRVCAQCASELPPRPLRWGETAGSKAFCRSCFPDKPSWLVAQQKIEAMRRRICFNAFWNDCRHSHLHTMPLWQTIYGLELSPKVYTDDLGKEYTVTALILPPTTILGLFLPVRDRPGEHYRLGWWSPFEPGGKENLPLGWWDSPGQGKGESSGET